jgi:tryptophan 2,3-dioxygenase
MHSNSPNRPADLTYGSYLAVDELLSLQRPQSVPEHPDELLFIVVHQASELWFKAILRELERLIEALAAASAVAALATARRLNGLVRIVSAQLAALDTLAPQRFAEFRGYLGTASGGQSIQFRSIEALSGLRDPDFLGSLGPATDIAEPIARALQRPRVEDLFLDLVRREGSTLEEVYADRNPTLLFVLAESLLEYDQGFQHWRYLHIQLVDRIIGPDTSGTGGTAGSRFLWGTLSQRFFPKLWEVRGRFFREGQFPSRQPGA